MIPEQYAVTLTESTSKGIRIVCYLIAPDVFLELLKTAQREGTHTMTQEIPLPKMPDAPGS